MRTQLLCLLLLATLPAFAQKEDKQLYAKLKPLLDAHRGVAGVYVHHLKKNKFVAINADTVFPTASMIKTPIAIGVFDKIAKGELQYDSLLEYKDSLLYAGEDILGSFKSGEKIALNKVMMLMLTMSDNTASLWLQSLAGGGTAINAWLEGQGFVHTRVNSRTPGRRDNQRVYGWGQTSPREMATLMEMIYTGKVISPVISDRIYRNLTRNFWDAQGLQQVPKQVRTASKNGAVDESRSEVIMVNAPHGDYVYCIITKENKDQRWAKNNEALVLLRAVGFTIWGHYEKGSKWTPIPIGEQF
ncbi:class A beta-lactamase-related serine hydrolase [Chitinophaga horti]|uniref:beta-lactamase n=1 Tax=Chitinophaga horti TaxID=2920382 RepID=A0ABY6J513_9BACT|nr:serine hydrolase [Chitinophaga horti]UYQ94763.1 class A beta-lactamase-related serine hydrolase [Chitinophaga horti]